MQKKEIPISYKTPGTPSTFSNNYMSGNNAVFNYTLDPQCRDKDNNIEYISSIPSCDFDEDYSNLFEKKHKGSIYSRIVNQIFMIFNDLGSDGGLFVLIGKKK